MKIKVSQFVYGDLTSPESWFAKFVEPINRMYCELHGYEYAVERLESIRLDRHGNWEKIPHIFRSLTDCDYLLFVDADALFYNHLFTIEEEMLPLLGDDSLFLVASDCGGEEYRWCPWNVNSGVMLFRNTTEARRMLTDWNEIVETPQYEWAKWHFPSEQQICSEYIVAKYKASVVKDYYRFNGIFGQYIRHFLSACCQDRHSVLKAVYHSPLMERNRKLHQLLK